MFRRLGLRLRPIDALWRLGIGLITRVIDAIVNLGASGATGLEPLPLIDGGPNGATLALSVVSPVLIGTFVFGLLAGAVTAATGRLGGAIIAHVVFNGLAVWATWGA